MSRILLVVLFAAMLVSCAAPGNVNPTAIMITLPSPTAPIPTDQPETPTPFPIPITGLESEPTAAVPAFEHIVLIVFENKEFGKVIGNAQMPEFNRLAKENTLLTQYYAVRHPSLPNYIALIGGDTFGIKKNCTDCFIDATSLPDLIEASGRTWKTYQEDMPEPCYLEHHGDYAQKHNPFVYFDAIRQDQERCQNSVVPLTRFHDDLLAGNLPNFSFITPNMCNDAHDCSLEVTDGWLQNQISVLVPALELTGQPYLIVLLFDEGHGDQSCCGLPQGGGRVATVLVSPWVKAGFEDETPYTHYSLLKTISASWGLAYLGHAADQENVLITAPWK